MGQKARLMRCLAVLLLVVLTTASVWAQALTSVPIHYLPGSEDGLIEGHLFWLPVEVNGKPSKFILDTGIGVNLISAKLAREIGCPETGQIFHGQNVSGQTVDVPWTWYPSLSLGGVEQNFVTTGVLDFDSFFAEVGRV